MDSKKLGFNLPLNELASISLLSLKIAICALIGILPLSILSGWWLCKRKGLHVSISETVLLLPMVLPPSSCGLILLTILSPKGVLGNFLSTHMSINFLLNWQGAVIAAAFVSFPILMRSCQQAFIQIPTELLEASKAFGLTGIQTFLQVGVPLALPGIINGCILALARSLSEFGSTIMVAGLIPGQTETLALAIYARTISGKDHEAWTLALVSLGLAFILLFLNRVYLRHSQGREERG